MAEGYGAVDLAPAPPHIIGPTWRTTQNGNWYLPEHSLGWGVVDWLATYVRSPAGENKPHIVSMLDSAGMPPDAFVPTDEQLRFLLWWYSVTEDGNYSYREGVLRRIKGWGKDPIAAALALAELCGPVAFSHFDEYGNAVGTTRHAAWVTVAAISLDQTKNTFGLFPLMVSKKLKQDYSLEVNKFILYSGAGGRLEAATSSPASIEGNRPTFVIENEAIALDTPIPTPSGWTTIGEIETGDVIFGSDGNPTEVVKALEVQHGRDCYEVVFQDGTLIVASDGHLWQTRVAGSAAKPKIRTTKELVTDGRRFMVPRSGARQTPDVQLPVDPYLLGAWLGDGSTGDCAISAGDEDVDELERQLNGRGIPTHRRKTAEGRGHRVSFSGRRAAARPEPSLRIRELDCFRNKHIPREYLESGTEQRVELLRGLMDTDGCASERGRCIFTGRKRLAEDVVELLRGLGQLPGISFVKDPRSRDGGYYRVTFTPWRIQPFAFKRKADRVVQSKRDWVSIKEIRPVPSVPVRCIAVSADDRLFQAGVSGHTTHNTQFWGAGPTGEFNDGIALHMGLVGNLSKTPGARRLAICNAHIPGNGSLGERDWEGYLDTVAGKTVDTGMLYDAIEAPADTPVSEIPSKMVDPEGFEAGVEELRQGIMTARGDSSWLPVEAILMSILDAKNLVSESRRKFLNQINAREDSWIAPTEWDAITDIEAVLADGEDITLGFDGSKSSDMTALVACRVSDGCLFPINIWDPEISPNGEIDRVAVDEAVRACFAKYHVVAFRADVKEFEAYVDQWSRDFKKTLKVNACPGNPVAYDMRGNSKKFALDCERFLGAVLDKEVSHNGNVVLRQHVLNAKRHPTSFNAVAIRKQSRDSSRKIDAAVCAVLAFGARQDFLMSKKNLSRRAAVIM